MRGNLVLTFEDQNSRKRTLTIHDIPETVDPAAVKELADITAQSNIFGTPELDWYVIPVSGKLVLTNEVTYFTTEIPIPLD